MIEKQSGIQIIGEVDQEAGRAFADFVKAPLAIVLLVLIGTFLPLAHLEKDLFGWQFQQRWQHSPHLFQTAMGALGIDTGRWCVLLHMQPLLVTVHRYRVFGQIGIIQPVTMHAFALCPAFQMAQVLAQAIDKGIGAIGPRPFQRLITAAPIGGVTVDEKFRRDLEL